MSEVLLTVKQAAERLQLHPLTVRRQLRAGTLRGIKRGSKAWRVPESALYEDQPVNPAPVAAKGADESASTQVEAIWSEMTSGDAQRHNNALRVLFQAPAEVQAIVMQRSGEAAAHYYATPEGEAELADWRALDGEPFYDEEGDGDDL